MKPMYLCDACLETWYTNQARHEGYGVCQRCHGGNRKLSYIYNLQPRYAPAHQNELEQAERRGVERAMEEIAYSAGRVPLNAHAAVAIASGRLGLPGGAKCERCLDHKLVCRQCKYWAAAPGSIGHPDCDHGNVYWIDCPDCAQCARRGVERVRVERWTPDGVVDRMFILDGSAVRRGYADRAQMLGGANGVIAKIWKDTNDTQRATPPPRTVPTKDGTEIAWEETKWPGPQAYRPQRVVVTAPETDGEDLWLSAWTMGPKDVAALIGAYRPGPHAPPSGTVHYVPAARLAETAERLEQAWQAKLDSMTDYASDLDRHRFETQQRLERSVYTTARRIAKWLVIRSSSYVHLATAITRDQEWMTLEVDEATPHATPSGKDQAT